MSDEKCPNVDLSVDDLLSWKPPKPAIDIDDIKEIEKFLYGADIDLNDLCDEFRSLIINQEMSQDEKSGFTSLISVLSNASSSCSDSFDCDIQARLEALLEAAGIGKLSQSDRKAFTDPEVLQRLSSSVSNALEEAKLTFCKDHAEKKSFQEESSKRGTAADMKATRNASLNASAKRDDGKRLLLLACSSGFAELVEVLLSVPPYADESTYLTNATSQNLKKKINNNFLSTLNQQLTKVLLNMHSNADCYDGGIEGHTPLVCAASAGHKDIVHLLISHGADINATSKDGNTALICACAAGFTEVVHVLLENGANSECRVRNGWLPMKAAAHAGHVGVAKILVNQGGAKVNARDSESGATLLSTAAGQDQTEMIKFLLEDPGKHSEEDLHFALLQACKRGAVESVRRLLDAMPSRKLDKNKTLSPLYEAVLNGHVSTVDLLASRGASLTEPNSEGFTFLMLAAKEGNTEMLCFLLEKGVHVDAKTSKHETALSLACRRGHSDCVRILVKAGAHLEVGPASTTPLMEAIHGNYFHVVKFLLGEGANLHSVNERGESALSIACSSDNLDVLDCLLSNGAGLEKKDNSGLTPLMKAAQSGHVTTVRLLLDRGACVNAGIENNGHTALSLACRAAHYPVAKLLLDRGACPFYWLRDGSNLLLEASKGGNSRIVELFLNYSASCSCAQSASCQSLAVSPVPTTKLPETSLVRFRQTSEGCSAYCEPQPSAFSQTKFEPSIADLSPDLNLTKANFDASLQNNQLMLKTILPTVSSYDIESDVTTDVEACLCSLKKKILDERRSAEAVLIDAQEKVKGFEQKLKEIAQKNFCSEFDHAHLNDKKYVDKALELFEVNEEQVHQKQKIIDEMRKIEDELRLQQLKCNSTVEKEFVVKNLFQKPNGSQSGAGARPNDNCQQEEICETCSYPQVENVQLSNRAGRDSLPGRCRVMHVNECSDTNQDSPLSFAAARHHNDLARFLISRGANVNHQNKKGFTPLHLAVNEGHVSVVLLLLDAGADMEATTYHEKETPLTLACFQGRTEIAEILLAAHANKEYRNKSGYNSISLAAARGSDKIVRSLIVKGAKLNSCVGGMTPLMTASLNGHESTVTLLLNAGANVHAQNEADGNTALSFACLHGQARIVQLLLDSGANVERKAKNGLNPLMEAANRGFVVIAILLLDYGANPNSTSSSLSRDTALTIAAGMGHRHFCDLLISRGARYEMKNSVGNTPLWLACNAGHLDVVQLLVALGANVDEADSRKVSPLMAAFKKGFVKIVNLLVTKVNHLPSESTCLRIMAIVSNQEHRKLLYQCMCSIQEARSLLDKKAKEVAFNLLKELDLQKNRRQKQSKRRRNKRLKRREQKTLNSYDDEDAEENQDQGDADFDRADRDNSIEVVSPLNPNANNRDRQPFDVDDSTEIADSSVLKTSSSRPVNKSLQSETQKSSSIPKNRTAFESQIYCTTKRRTWPNDEWRKVARKCPAAIGVKRIVIPSHLISRLIGRAGCNVNAIRDVTGASIDIEKLKAGVVERTVSIKGTADCIRHAQQLIDDLIDNDQSQPSVNIGNSNQNSSQATERKSPKQSTATLIAPIPTRPAWVVPPSIVRNKKIKSDASLTSASFSTQATEASSSLDKKEKDPIDSSVTRAFSSCFSLALTTVVQVISTHVAVTASVLCSVSPDKSPSKPMQPVLPFACDAIPTVSEPSRKVTSQPNDERCVLSFSSVAQQHSLATDVVRAQQDVTTPGDRGPKCVCASVVTHGSVTIVQTFATTKANPESTPYQIASQQRSKSAASQDSTVSPLLSDDRWGENVEWSAFNKCYCDQLMNDNTTICLSDVTANLNQSKPASRVYPTPIGSERAHRRAVNKLAPISRPQYCASTFQSCLGSVAGSSLTEDATFNHAYRHRDFSNAFTGTRLYQNSSNFSSSNFPFASSHNVLNPHRFTRDPPHFNPRLSANRSSTLHENQPLPFVQFPTSNPNHAFLPFCTQSQIWSPWKGDVTYRRRPPSTTIGSRLIRSSATMSPRTGHFGHFTQSRDSDINLAIGSLASRLSQSEQFRSPSIQSCALPNFKSLQPFDITFPGRYIETEQASPHTPNRRWTFNPRSFQSNCRSAEPISPNIHRNPSQLFCTFRSALADSRYFPVRPQNVDVTLRLDQDQA